MALLHRLEDDLARMARLVELKGLVEALERHTGGYQLEIDDAVLLKQPARRVPGSRSRDRSRPTL